MTVRLFIRILGILAVLVGSPASAYLVEYDPTRRIQRPIPEFGNFSFLGNTKWDGENDTSHFDIAPRSPGGATWSIMPIGTTSVEPDRHGGSGDVGELPVLVGGLESWYRDALNVWADVSGFTNLGIRLDTGADFNSVGFHGDIRIGGIEFDGPGGILAHAYQPADSDQFLGFPSLGGDVHIDVMEDWCESCDEGFHFAVMLIHEFGHALGLGHSTDPNAIMYPFLSRGVSKSLGFDDIAGIQAIYGDVPEPGTATLIGLGLLGLALWRSRSS